jgi:EpsD family peptidyl-prolyl cis-trans isomerase
MIYRGGAAALIAVLMATSGCDKQATGQSVAVVNGEEISQTELNAELQAANVPESVDKKEVMPQLLQRVVDRRLVAQRAAEQGLDKTPDFLGKQRRMNENLLIGLYGERQADTVKVPTAQEISAFIAANPSMFQGREILALNQLIFDRPADLNVLKGLQNAHSLDAVAAALGQLGIPFQRNQGRLDTASVPPPIAKQINGLPPGEPFVVPAGNKIVVSAIAGRQSAAMPAQESQRIAAEQIRRQKLGEMMERQLKEMRAAAKIEYQPGFAPKADAKAGTKAGGQTKS